MIPLVCCQPRSAWPSSRPTQAWFAGRASGRLGTFAVGLDIEAGKVDTLVCYKIDRLSRSLTDFAKLVDAFERHGVSFVSVTQSFCTTTSMGRLTLNILLSFALFEREVIGERIRDKFAASRAKGLGWAASRRSAMAPETGSWW
jgi:site-specific DNA recombinase